ncbi:MAG: geranylgeranyl reductase family protein [Nitrospirae bacterium]|nr:geranylgeranyl reductase family protein [Nitrospirota bacterium]
MIRTNVLIIGGGPAGATAARILAANKIETTLVERDLSYAKPCGGGIPSSAFEELDIPETCVKKKIKKISIVSPAGEKIDVELAGGYLCITERGSFDKHLRQLALEQGASIMEGLFNRFEENGNNVISVVQKKISREEIRIKADYVIAADGITSKTASALKIPRPAAISTVSALIKPADYDACEFWFGTEHASNFYSWVFPSDGYASIGTGSTTPKNLTSFLDVFVRRRFHASLEEMNRQNLLGKTRAFKMPEWNGTLFNRGNVLFAGDAAGTVLPVLYEGIYYAMKSGELAARALIDGNPDLYKKLWNSRFRSRFLLMRAIRKHLFRDNERIEKWVELHKRPDVQELAMKLWLNKKYGGKSILSSYVKMFRHFIKY